MGEIKYIYSGLHVCRAMLLEHGFTTTELTKDSVRTVIQHDANSQKETTNK